MVPEELEKSPVPAQPSQQQQAIADIEALIDSEGGKERPQPSVPSYDKTTPVDEIMKTMDAATARTIVFENGKYKGQTVGAVYESTKDNNGFSSKESTKDNNGFSGKLKWFADNYRTNNILVAACIIVNKS